MLFTKQCLAGMLFTKQCLAGVKMPLDQLEDFLPPDPLHLPPPQQKFIKSGTAGVRKGNTPLSARFQKKTKRNFKVF